MTDANFQSQQYRRRNAFAAAVESLLLTFSKREQFKLEVKGKFETHEKNRVQTSDWMSGFFMDCTGLDRKAEAAIVEEVKVLFPKLRVLVSRKTVLRPRYVEFSF
jgi:hypothetical protein